MKMAKPTIDVRSDVSCYVKIGDYTLYLEVSSETDNKPFVSYWHKDMSSDAEEIKLKEVV